MPNRRPTSGASGRATKSIDRPSSRIAGPSAAPWTATATSAASEQTTAPPRPSGHASAATTTRQRQLRPAEAAEHPAVDLGGEVAEQRPPRLRGHPRHVIAGRRPRRQRGHRLRGPEGRRRDGPGREEQAQPQPGQHEQRPRASPGARDRRRLSAPPSIVVERVRRPAGGIGGGALGAPPRTSSPGCPSSCGSAATERANLSSSWPRFECTRFTSSSKFFAGAFFLSTQTTAPVSGSIFSSASQHGQVTSTASGMGRL